MTNFFTFTCVEKVVEMRKKYWFFDTNSKSKKTGQVVVFLKQQCGLIKALVTLEESKHLLTGEQRKKSPITKEPLNREMDP